MCALCVRKVTVFFICLSTAVVPFHVCLFFFIYAAVFWSETMSLAGSGNYLPKSSWPDSLGFTVNPEADNGLVWQLFVLAGYFQANSCTVLLSVSYHGSHSPALTHWHISVCVSVSVCVCISALARISVNYWNALCVQCKTIRFNFPNTNIWENRKKLFVCFSFFISRFK